MEAEQRFEKTVEVTCEMFKNIEAVIDNNWLKQKGLETFEFMKQIQKSVKSITLMDKELVINCSSAQYDNICKQFRTGVNTEADSHHVPGQLQVELNLDENIWEYMEQIYAREIKTKKVEHGVRIKSFSNDPSIRTVIIVPEKKSASAGCNLMKKFILNLHELLASSIVEDIERAGIRLNDENADIMMEKIKNRFGDVLIKRLTDGDGEFIIIGPPASCHEVRQRIRSLMRPKIREPKLLDELRTMNKNYREVDDKVKEKVENFYNPFEVMRRNHDGAEGEKSVNYEEKKMVAKSPPHSAFRIFNNTNIELDNDDHKKEDDDHAGSLDAKEAEHENKLQDFAAVDTHSNDDNAHDDDDDDGDNDDNRDNHYIVPDDDDNGDNEDGSQEDDDKNDDIAQGFFSMPLPKRVAQEFREDEEEHHNSVLKSGFGSSRRKKLPDL